MIIIYDRENVHTISLGKIDPKNKSAEAPRKKIVFLPGRNEVTPELWKEFEDLHPKIFNCLLEDKVLQVFATDDKVSYKDLSRSDTILLIKNTMNVDELKSYLKIENKKQSKRKDVIATIEHQIAALEEDFSKKKDNKNG